MDISVQFTTVNPELTGRAGGGDGVRSSGSDESVAEMTLKTPTIQTLQCSQPMLPFVNRVFEMFLNEQLKTDSARPRKKKHVMGKNGFLDFKSIGLLAGMLLNSLSSGRE